MPDGAEDDDLDIHTDDDFDHRYRCLSRHTGSPQGIAGTPTSTTEGVM